MTTFGKTEQQWRHNIYGYLYEADILLFWHTDDELNDHEVK